MITDNLPSNQPWLPALAAILLAIVVAFVLNLGATANALGHWPLLVGNLATYTIYLRYGSWAALPVALAAGLPFGGQPETALPAIELAAVAAIHKYKQVGLGAASLWAWALLAPVAFGLRYLGVLNPLFPSQFPQGVAVEALACVLSAYVADALQPLFWRQRSDTRLRDLLSRLLTLFSAIPALLILFWTVPSYVTEVRQQLVDNTHARGDAIHAKISGYVESHKQVIQALAAHWRQSGDLEGLHAWLRSIKEHYPGFKTLFVADARGQLQIAQPEPSGKDWQSPSTSVSDRTYFKQIVLTGRPYISRVFRGRGVGNKPIVVIGAPLRKKDQTHLSGIVAGSLRLDNLAEVLTTKTPTDTVALVDDRSRFIVAKGPAALASLQPVPDDSPIKKALSRSDANHVFIHGRLAVRTDIESTPWKLIQIVPLENTAAAINTYTLIVGSLALLFVFASREWATRLAAGVSIPIEKMSAIASKIRANVPMQPFDLDEHTAPKEVVLLADHLNRMLHDLSLARHRLQQSLAEKTDMNERLQVHNKSLDAQVQKKTSELMKAKEEAEQLAQSRSAYLAAMSHEIRTPVSGLLGLVRLFDDSNLEPEQKEQLATIKRCGESLLNIVNSVLDNAKIDSGFMELDMHVIEPQSLVEDTVRLFSAEAKAKGNTIGLECDKNLASLPPLQGDPLRIKQILGNLLSNAIKFTRQGHIDVRLRVGKKDDEKVWLRYEVEDNGIGIPPEQIERIFEPFNQANAEIQSRYGGSGLGLTISRKLAVMMGGHLEFRKADKKGSIFTLSLPHQIVQPTSRRDEAETDEAVLLRDKRVLIAEDNTVNQKIIQSIVKNLGMESDVASNGKEVLQKLDQARFDLILMDCQMPTMDGYTATRQIRSSNAPYANIPIVAVTAHASPGDRERCLVAGMNDHIGKPYSLDRVRSVILNQLLDQQRADRQVSG